jgi:hypothetical protein
LLDQVDFVRRDQVLGGGEGGAAGFLVAAAVPAQFG